MARCDCTKCGCSVAQNGVVLIESDTDVALITELVDSTRVGWRDNVVVGRGTTPSPYEISFVDSVEYRPWAAEMRQAPFTSFEFTASSMQYNQNNLFVWAAGFPEDIHLTEVGILLGCSVVVNSGATLVDISLEIFVEGFSPDGGLYSLGSHTVGNSPSPILNAVGYLSPLRTFPVSSSGLVATVHVSLFSSVLVAYDEVRVWGMSV